MGSKKIETGQEGERGSEPPGNSHIGFHRNKQFHFHRIRGGYFNRSPWTPSGSATVHLSIIWLLFILKNWMMDAACLTGILSLSLSLSLSLWHQDWTIFLPDITDKISVISCKWNQFIVHLTIISQQTKCKPIYYFSILNLVAFNLGLTFIENHHIYSEWI